MDDPLCDLIDLHLDLQRIILRKFPCHGFPVLNSDTAAQSAALYENFLKDTHQLCLFAAVKHRILHRQRHLVRAGIRDLRRSECRVLNMAVFPEFLKNTVPVFLHQIFRCILGGELKPLLNDD